MRRPRVHNVFDIGRDIGVSNILAGSTEIEDAVVASGTSNLDVIPCGPIPPNPSEMIGSRRMLRLIEALRKDYNRIIVDSPPVTAVTDSVILAQVVDGVVLVVRAGDTPRQVVLNGVNQLRTVDSNILGAVLNGVNTGKDSYYYYQYYYYYYGDDGRRKKKTERRKRQAGAYKGRNEQGARA